MAWEKKESKAKQKQGGGNHYRGKKTSNACVSHVCTPVLLPTRLSAGILNRDCGGVNE